MLRGLGTPALLLALVVVVVVGLVMLLVHFVAEPMRVSSDSMEPTFGSGDEVLVQKLGAADHQPGRGTVVVIRAPSTGELLIKRVVALGPDGRHRERRAEARR